MRIPPNLVMLAVVGVAGSVLFAAESNQKAKEQPAAAAPAAAPAAASPLPQPSPAPGAGEGADKKEKDPDQDPAAKAAPRTEADKSAARAASPQRFVPSEEVRPDFDVSFPIDI